MTFTLSIELGNEAMLTYNDLALALRAVAANLGIDGDDKIEDADDWDRRGVIRDLNGNRVGQWEAK